ncbi:hypothetical protein [Allochromatium palmeri]|uniref:CBS domain-containing protein n=1 Tax=Allochromatium palmeri TaxID=231048 RepID=A0A6N8ECK2_9GAMM|nr:hypothetical protein [Allochromatium palmeri]MTW21068.1 hypothetical protein [Allochromatium palmeri]
MQLHEIMTPDGHIIQHRDSIRQAAELMRDLDIGILPIQEKDQLTKGSWPDTAEERWHPGRSGASIF